MKAIEKLDKLNAQIDEEFKPMGEKYGCRRISDLAFVYENADFLKEYGFLSTISEDAANVLKKLGFKVWEETRHHKAYDKVWEIRVPKEEMPDGKQNTESR